MSKVIERALHSKEVLRREREKLFKAFDIYKSNVEYGIINESEELHNQVVEWYNKCLALDYGAINNPPQEVVRYL